MDNMRERIDQELTYLAESLFTSIPRPGPSWHLNATLHLGGWDSYALGYKEIADMVVDRLMECRSMPDYQAYPIIFLYRHYLELRLKELLMAASELIDEYAETPMDHKLLPLWEKIRPHLERVWGDERSLAHHDDIAARLTEFDAVDPGSFAFRYPEDTKGNPVLQELRVINVRRVRDVVMAISHVLDGSSMSIDHHLDMKHEMEAEHRAEMRHYYEESGP